MEDIIQKSIGGRYYSKEHHFLEDDALSVALNEFKRKPLKQINDYFDRAIYRVNQNEKIDILTYVPLKPNEIEEARFNRFKSLELEKTKNNGILLQEIIKCNKNFFKKGKVFMLDCKM